MNCPERNHLIEVKPVVEMFLKPLAIAKEERDKNYKKMGAGPLNAHSHYLVPPLHCPKIHPHTRASQVVIFFFLP